MILPLQRSTPDQADRHGLAWASWPADLATPVMLYQALRDRGRRACLLESVEGSQRLARYSFVAVDPEATFRSGPDGHELRGLDVDLADEPGSLEALRAASRRAFGESRRRPPSELPPFCGGWIGYFGYELATQLEPRVPRAAHDPHGLPDALLELYRSVLAIDHASQRLFIVVAADSGAEFALAQARIDELAGLALAPARPGGAFVCDGALEPNLSAEAYREGVARLRHEVGQGEIFQAVLARRFEAPCEGDPLTLYRALRLCNASPHMFLFESDEVTLVGSSPERLVAVRDGRCELRPIAGTRPRGADTSADERLAAELCADVKERAEHDMLVDLARNDLGRIARIGSVSVRQHAVLERFARVQHLVSRVEADLASGRDALHALAACFPAGTVSGAPKVRAMELLAELEPDRRGPYAGGFGYLDAAGDLDVALIIRSFVLQPGRLSVQAGAGVVFDSDPAAEERETVHKASALFDAVELACSPTFSGATNLEAAR